VLRWGHHGCCVCCVCCAAVLLCCAAVLLCFSTAVLLCCVCAAVLLCCCVPRLRVRCMVCCVCCAVLCCQAPRRASAQGRVLARQAPGMVDTSSTPSLFLARTERKKYVLEQSKSKRESKRESGGYETWERAQFPNSLRHTSSLVPNSGSARPTPTLP
jgi:hypothetical protein